MECLLGSKRNRRIPEQILGDLQTEMDRVKARAAARRLSRMARAAGVPAAGAESGGTEPGWLPGAAY